MCMYMHRSAHIYIHIYTYIYTNILLLFFIFSRPGDNPSSVVTAPSCSPIVGQMALVSLHRKNPPTTVHSVTRVTCNKSHATYTFKTVGMCHLGNGGLCDTRQPKWLQWFRHPMSGHGNLVLMVAPYECIYAKFFYLLFSLFIFINFSSTKSCHHSLIALRLQ